MVWIVKDPELLGLINSIIGSGVEQFTPQKPGDIGLVGQMGIKPKGCFVNIPTIKRNPKTLQNELKYKGKCHFYIEIVK